MLRQIIHIDKEKCNGCGLCARACHEGAIDMVDGVAHLVRENFCDGLGDCLPNCPTGAITFEEREAPAYDEAAVKEAKQARQTLAREKGMLHSLLSGKGEGMACPGSQVVDLGQGKTRKEAATSPEKKEEGPISQLMQWPCQIKLVPTQAPFYEGADLLIAADCTAYAYAAMHEDFMKGRVTLIGCPKLDAVDYSEKLLQILSLNHIQSLTLVRMEVPCCGGLERAAKKALLESGKSLPWRVVTISRDGAILA